MISPINIKLNTELKICLQLHILVTSRQATIFQCIDEVQLMINIRNWNCVWIRKVFQCEVQEGPRAETGRAACLLVAVVHRHKSKGGIKMVVLAINQLSGGKRVLSGCGGVTWCKCMRCHSVKIYKRVCVCECARSKWMRERTERAAFLFRCKWVCLLQTAGGQNARWHNSRLLWRLWFIPQLRAARRITQLHFAPAARREIKCMCAGAFSTRMHTISCMLPKCIFAAKKNASVRSALAKQIEFKWKALWQLNLWQE